MLVLITYDVNTEDAAGRRRLRWVARQCVNYGQRVQNSVFECVLDAAQYRQVQAKLIQIADLEREWDMELLTRSRTGVVLSSSGAALLPYVQAVCNAGRELEEQVAELHGLTRGTLRVATFASVSKIGRASCRERV